LIAIDKTNFKIISKFARSPKMEDGRQKKKKHGFGLLTSVF
jgi:hypothetical protein